MLFQPALAVQPGDAEVEQNDLETCQLGEPAKLKKKLKRFTTGCCGGTEAKHHPHIEALVLVAVVEG